MGVKQSQEERAVKKQEENPCNWFFPTNPKHILDATGIYVDINKMDTSDHCFSGDSKFPTFELGQGGLKTIHRTSEHTTRIHIICSSRKDHLPEDIQRELYTSGVREIVLFTTDMRYLCPFQVLVAP